jgi:hypothetical protein
MLSPFYVACLAKETTDHLPHLFVTYHFLFSLGITAVNRLHKKLFVTRQNDKAMAILDVALNS